MLIDTSGPLATFSELQQRYDAKKGQKNVLASKIAQKLDSYSNQKYVQRDYHYELPSSQNNVSSVNYNIRRLNII